MASVNKKRECKKCKIVFYSESEECPACGNNDDFIMEVTPDQAWQEALTDKDDVK